jgi:hypothetical protein
MADSGRLYAGHAYHDAWIRRRQHISSSPFRAAVNDVPMTGVTLVFLNRPGPKSKMASKDVKGNPLVVMLHYGTFGGLFMGDVGLQPDARLLAQTRIHTQRSNGPPMTVRIMTSHHFTS